jgi:hypothetical protein
MSDTFFINSQYLGPKLMANREPFQLRKIIIAYNLFQVLANLRLFYLACTLGWLTTGDHAANWRCDIIDRSPTGLPLMVSFVTHTSISSNEFYCRLQKPFGFITSANSPSSLTRFSL